MDATSAEMHRMAGDCVYSVQHLVGNLGITAGVVYTKLISVLL